MVMPLAETGNSVNPDRSHRLNMSPQTPPDIQLVVLDIDGTLVGESNEIRAAVKQAVKAVQGRGIPVAIATGRMYRSAVRFHQELDLTLPLMAYQGAWIQDPKQPTPHHHLSLPTELAMDLLDYLNQPHLQDRISIHLYLDDVLHLQETSPETEAYAQRAGVEGRLVTNLQDALARGTTKLLAQSSDTSLIDRLAQELKQRYSAEQVYLTRSMSPYLEALHPLANKGHAVRTLAEAMLNLQPEQVLAIGDQFNDLEMLDYAGYGIAMAAAPDEVKAVAQWIAPSVEDDGVAVALEQFILRH